MIKNLLLVISGLIILLILYGVLSYVLTRILLNKKTLLFLKNKGLLYIGSNIISFSVNFLSVLVLYGLLGKFNITLMIFSVIIFALLSFKNIYHRIHLIKSDHSMVKHCMPDPENYNKSDDLKKEYWRLFYEIVGLVLGTTFILFYYLWYLF